MTTKKEIFSLAIIVGLSVGIIGTVTVSSVMAQESESLAVDYSLTSTEEIPCQHESIFLESSSHMQISPQKQAEMDARLAVLDEEYEQVMQEYGFVFEEPELTIEQQHKLEDILEEIMMSHQESLGQFDVMFNPFMPYVEEELSEEEFKKFNETMIKIEEDTNKVLREFGFVIEEPTELSEQEQQEMEKRLAEIDRKYEQVFSEYEFGYSYGDDDYYFVIDPISELSTEKQAEFEKRLSELDAQYQELYKEFGL